MATVTNYNTIIFEDWIYDNYNNEGTWVTVDLSAYLGKHMSLIRISAQVIDIDTDGSEYVNCKIRQYNTNYKTSSNCCTTVQYNEGLKGEMHCWTDENAKIEYFIDYGWWETKKVKVRLVLEHSIN